MASEWFYQVMGEQVGPISGAELRNLAQRGTITIDTSIANALNGPWVPAGRVRGLFAIPTGTPPAAATTRTIQAPTSNDATPEESSGLGTATKTMLIVCVGVSILVLGFLVWFIASRDTWELNNASSISGKLDEADLLQQSDPLKAYKIYDEILKEAKQHKITDEQFSKRITDAKKTRTALYQKVQEQIRAEEVEEQRRVEEKARLAAAEQRRISEQQERKLAAEEAERIAKEKRRAEEERRKESISAYRNAPQFARNALNVVKKVEARTEVGINYRDYSAVVGEGWGEVKVFAESPDGKAVPEFSVLLVSAMAKYKLALDVWQGKFGSDNVRFDEDLSDIVLKECWRAASHRLKVAESLVDKDDVAAGLSRAAVLRKVDDTYETTMRSLFPELILVHLNRKIAKLDPDDPKNRTDFENHVKKIADTLEALIKQDMQEP